MRIKCPLDVSIWLYLIIKRIRKKYFFYILEVRLYLLFEDYLSSTCFA